MTVDQLQTIYDNLENPKLSNPFDDYEDLETIEMILSAQQE